MTAASTAFDLICSSERVLVAIDDAGLHVRKTVSVLHDGLSGEARYSTAPVASFAVNPQVREAVAAAVVGGATNEARVRKQLEQMGVEVEDGDVRCGEPYIVQRSPELLLLDGTFSVADLEALVWVMRNRPTH